MTNFLGAWNPNTVYWGQWLDDAHTQAHAGGADEVEYQGAYWIANYYNEDFNPVADQPGDGGAWMLDPNGPAIVYDQVTPEAPTDLKVGFTSSASVALSWHASEVLGVGDVTSYDVFEDGVKIASTTGTNFTVTGLTASTRYDFTVDAVDLTGASSQSGVLAVTTHGGEMPSGQYFSPYVDMTLPSTDLAQLSADSGLRDFTLAFMQTSKDALDGNGNLLAGATPSVSWGGLASTTLPSGTIIDEVRDAEAQGGTVTISFGGYNGQDPAVIAAQYAQQLESSSQHLSATAAEKAAAAHLQQEYQSVIETYGVNSLDFDIENQSVVNNTEANHLRDLAIKGLEAINPDLKISYTLATLPSGLADSDSAGGGNDYNVLVQAKADGTRVDVVNIMAMDYFDGDKNDMADNAISAAKAVEAQVQHIGLGAEIGITPMIGQNDDYGPSDPGSDGVSEVFTLADAHTLEAFAAANPWVAGLGMWELPRDRASATDTTGTMPDSTSSGVVQSDFEFSSIFAAIATMASSGGETVRGNGGPNTLWGSGGDDVLSGLGGNDVLHGAGGDDTLNGGAGNDTLDGGSGADQMAGARGNDTYVVDNAGDVVIEGVNGGTDLVKSAVSYTLGANVENLTLTGTKALHGTGNGLANDITGNAGANHLSGGAGNDILHGGAGNDVLDGGTGIDRMAGGAGNDTYVVDRATDTVAEARSGGTDLVKSSVSYTLGANLENLTLTGTRALHGTGNALANHIAGNAGANVLDGGAGTDVLKGGAGNDTFVFDTRLAKAGIDSIADFSHGHDHIALDNAVFAALGPKGHLDADFFIENATGKATTHDQHVIYDSETGALFYDQDGSGGHAAVQFATLAHHPALLAAADFLVT